MTVVKSMCSVAVMQTIRTCHELRSRIFLRSSERGGGAANSTGGRHLDLRLLVFYMFMCVFINL